MRERSRFWAALRRTLRKLAGYPYRGVDEYGGLATGLVDSLDAAAAALPALQLAPSMSVAQPIAARFGELAEVAVRLETSRDFDQGLVILAGVDGSEIYREALDRRRIVQGVYALEPPSGALHAPPGGEFQLVVSHRGRSGRIVLPLARHGQAGLARAALLDGAATSGALALRVGGKLLTGGADYSRGPRAAALERAGSGPLYAAGLRFDGARAATPEAIYALPPGGAHALLLGQAIDLEPARALVRAANLRFVPVVGVRGAPDGGPHLAAAQLARWSDYLAVEGADVRSALEAWLPEYRRKLLPRMSLVAVLGAQAPQVQAALESCARQDYEGDFECIFFVPREGATTDAVDAFFAAARAAGAGRVPGYSIVRDRATSGGQGVEALGAVAAQGDIVVMAAGVPGRGVLTQHADAHSFGDCDVVSEPAGTFSTARLLAGKPLAALEESGRRVKILGAALPTPRRAAPARKLKILTYRWHVAHQYELYKSGHEFTLVNDLPTPITRGWDLRQRPFPDNARFVPWRTVREDDYDLALLHFDENVLSPENTNGFLGKEWGAAFRWFMERVRLPKVAVCHGTPQFRGQYDPEYSRPDLLQVIEDSRRKLVDYLGDTLVICNSHQALREWGFRHSRVIWHGFDPDEFPPATYERGILSPLGPLVLSRPHYRGYFLHREVFKDFPAEFAPSPLRVPDPSPLYRGNQFALWKYRNYVDEIRSYSVYFNPTQRSPMPRARAEPMMCGVVTVNANNHDVDMFIRNGENGFYAKQAGELREQLLFLSRNPAAAREIGAAGRRTACDLFHIDRYLGEWQGVLRSMRRA